MEISYDDLLVVPHKSTIDLLLLIIMTIIAITTNVMTVSVAVIVKIMMTLTTPINGYQEVHL